MTAYNPHPHSVSFDEIFIPLVEEFLNPPKGIELPDFPLLNSALGGFRPREFTILCGATGSGKTALCSVFAAELLRLGVPTFVASVETGAKDFARRVLSVWAKEDWNTGDKVVSEARLTQVILQNASFENWKKLRLSLYEDRFSVETLIENLDFHVSTYGTKIAFIDNLNFFMEVTSESNAVAEMDRVVHNLIMYCKRVDIHIVMVMHPKKTIDGRVTSEFDIKGSSTAVQEAQNVLLFNRAADLSEDNRTDRELKIAKVRRRGRYTGFTIKFKCDNGINYHEAGMVYK